MIKVIGQKTVYSATGREASKWVRQSIRKLKTYDAPQMKSGLNVAQCGVGKVTEHSLTYMHCHANKVMQSTQYVGFNSTTFSNGYGISVVSGEGWRRAIALFSARKLVKDEWSRHEDEYLQPLDN